MTLHAASSSFQQNAAPLLPEGLAEPLRTVVSGLAGPRQQIEGAFLDIGRDLIEGNSLLGGITATFSRLDGEDAADPFLPFETLARRVLAITGAAAGDTRDLSALIAHVSAIGRPVTALRSAVKSIGLVALGTRISASHLKGGHGFEAFTSDIMRLSERSTATITAFADVYGRLVATLAAAETKRVAFAATQKRALGGLTERLEASLASAALRREQAAQASAEIGRLFARIGEGISAIVMALQIGDITRQRIEHVEEGLAFLLDPAQIAAYAPDGNAAALVAAVCRLEAAQAGEANKDFDQEVGRVVTTIRQLAADAARIVAESRRIHEETVEASGAALAGLVEEVRRACRFMREYEAARAEMDEAAAAVTAALDELLRCVKAVQDIKGGMHIVGINMALKCAWLGPEGETLNVIAHELRELAGTTVNYANAAVVSLNEAAVHAEALTANAGGGNLAEIDSLEEDVRRSGLARGDRRTAEALNMLVRDGSQVAKLLEKAVARITIQKDIGGAMRVAIDRIERIRHDAEAAHAAEGGGDLRQAEERAMAQLKGRYTMASERALHDRHAGKPTTSPAPAASAPVAAETSLDDIFL